MRLFIAADIPHDTKERIRSFQDRLSASGCRMKFTEQENLHFTLKFLGEVEGGMVSDIRTGISSALEVVQPFRVSVEGAGFFGRPDRIRVVWAGVKHGRDELVKLARSLDRNLDQIMENKHSPSPHITIARVKESRDTRKLMREVNSHEHVKFGEFNLSAVTLKRSKLTDRGPVYSNVQVFALGEEGRKPENSQGGSS